MANSEIKEVQPKDCCGTCSNLGENLECFEEINCTKGMNLHEKIVFVTDLYHIKCDQYAV